MAYCEGCGISLEIDFDAEEGEICTQCKLRNVPGDTVRMQRWMLGKQITLTQGDIDLLDGSRSRSVRFNQLEDVEVKNLYDMYKSL